MNEISVGVLTISDRCFNGEAADESGENLVKMIEDGIIPNGKLVAKKLVSDNKEEIVTVLSEWSEEEKIHLILTTGGTGLTERDVTPEATCEVLQKLIPGIPALIFKKSSEITDLACLSRGVAGVNGKSLIINLPGSKKASKECLDAVAGVIPHAVDLILERGDNVERVHDSLAAKKKSVVVIDVVGRDRISPYPCIEVEEAQEIIDKRVLLLKREKTIKCDQALNYVLAQSVITTEDFPPFNASLKDGYAVLSEDRSNERRVVGVSSAGNLPDVSVTNGCCVRISTGAAVPLGANAVVPVEDTDLTQVKNDETEEDVVLINKFPKKNENIRPKGFDVCKGQMILSYGTYLDESALGLLVALGMTSVQVHDKPLVAIFSTGDELLDPAEKLQPGKVRDSNRITLINLLKKEFFETVDLGICPDHPDALRDSLEKAFQSADVVVTTGNMSMGDRDYLKKVLVSDFDAEIFFGRVLMKPGKPTSFGLVTFEGNPKFWFGLPGNPASAFVTSHLFLLPALRRSGFRENVYPNVVRATLCEPLPFKEDRPQYVRGILICSSAGKWFVKPKTGQQSSWIGGCVNANCLILVPSYHCYPETKRIKVEVETLLIGKPLFEDETSVSLL